MARRGSSDEGSPVPGTRLSRSFGLARVATGIGGRMILDGARQAVTGQRPTLSALLLTPANALRLTQELAHMRGAAMKVGQLLSMDAGEFIPADLARILARLQADAEIMPPRQLRATLDRHWGRGWLARFARFDVRPIASASIGQVHRAQTRDGRDLAIKVQYPGVRDSIDSDVGNVSTLLRMSGLVPRSLNLAPLLDEARRQLHQEADYVREGDRMMRFADLLSPSPDFVVPRLHRDLSGPDVLAMDHVDSQPIEVLANASQDDRDRVVRLLIGLVLDELFTFNLMQTDPNFANYRYRPETREVVLLDFGATRSFRPEVARDFRALMTAGLAGDRTATRDAAIAIGYFDATTRTAHQSAVLDMIDLAMRPLRAGGAFDFTDPAFANSLRDKGLALGMDDDFRHIPPMDVLLLHRKFGGLYLLASRLRARVDLGPLLAAHR